MQQVADKMNFQDPVQKYAECHSWDMGNSNATKYHEIKVGVLDNTCFKENVPTFEILVGWILRLGLNFWLINVAHYGWKCDPAYQGSTCKAWAERFCARSERLISMDKIISDGSHSYRVPSSFTSVVSIYTDILSEAQTKLGCNSFGWGVCTNLSAIFKLFIQCFASWH